MSPTIGGRRRRGITKRIKPRKKDRDKLKKKGVGEESKKI